MDDRRPNRAAKNSGMPASSIALTTAFHASVIFAFLWTPPIKSPVPMPDDAVEVTIERQAAPLPIQPPAPVATQITTQAESVETPTLEKAVAESEVTPEPTQHDFARLEPTAPKMYRKEPSPRSDPAPDLDAAFVPPPGWAPPTASSPTSFFGQGDIVQRSKAADDYLVRIARKISQYRRYNNRDYVGGLFTKLVIARDGRLVTADVLIPSDKANLDAEVMETIRLAAPYDPLPDKIEGEHATFILPCRYIIHTWH